MHNSEHNLGIYQLRYHMWTWSGNPALVPNTSWSLKTISAAEVDLVEGQKVNIIFIIFMILFISLLIYTLLNIPLKPYYTYRDGFARGIARRRPVWTCSSACVAQQYWGSFSFVSAHGPLLYNACTGDVTQQCVGISWHALSVICGDVRQE
jgi:hypothetical protein